MSLRLTSPAVMSEARRRELDNMTPEEWAAERARNAELAKEFLGNRSIFPLPQQPERSFEGDLKKTFGGLTPHPSVMTPNIRTKIEDFLGQMGDSTGPFPWKDFDEYLGRPGSRPEDRILHKEQWGNIPGPARVDPIPHALEHEHGPDRFLPTPPAGLGDPIHGPSPLDKTLERRVWERDQMPQRTPDAQGRLYPDKNDPGFIDPRMRGDGSMTMQYIPELDNPNWTPENPMPRSWGRGGEGVQYRR